MTVESWNETCLVALDDGTTVMNIAPIMTSVTINQGGKPVESTPNLSGGRILVFKPEEDTEIEFEGMPVGIGDKDATSQDGLDLFFHGGTSSAAPFSVGSSLTRTPMTLTIMWTDSTATSATSSVPSGNYALRYNFANSYLTVCQPSFTTDGGLVSKYTFKCAPRNKAGTANITKESTDGTASMATI
jgi:hypothetical protein